MTDVFFAYVGGMCTGLIIGLYVITCIDRLKGGDKS